MGLVCAKKNCKTKPEFDQVYIIEAEKLID